MQDTTIVAAHIGFPEAPRWHDNRLWFVDMWGKRLVQALDRDGQLQDILHVPTKPSGLGWNAAGDFFVVSTEDNTLLRRKAGAEAIEVFCDLSPLAVEINDMAVLPDGTAYIGDSGFKWGMEEPVLGRLLKVSPQGEASVVAEELAMPNGIAVSADERTLYVGETFGGRISQFAIDAQGDLGPRETFYAYDDQGWVSVMEQVAARPCAPDGICLNAAGQVWVANPLRATITCVSRQGVVAEVGLSQPGIACMLGGADRRTLYVATGDLGDMVGTRGKIEAVTVETPGAGFPAA